MRLMLLRVALFATLIAPIRALGSDYHWNNPLGGSFGEPTNWSEGAVPGPADTGVFATGSPTYSVMLDADRSLAGMSVQDDSVALDLGGFQLSLVDLSVAAVQQSYLAITNGSVVGSGPFSVCPIPVGDPHQGLHEAVFSGSTTTGTFQRITVWGDGAGTLRISDGAMLESTGTGGSDTTLSIGSRNATALVEVSGSSTLAVASSIRVGEAGTHDASLLITGGSQVSSQDVQGSSAGLVGFGPDAEAHVTVTGTNSSWVMDGRLTLGLGSNTLSTVDIRDGGSVQSTKARIAVNNGADGQLVIDGPGSQYRVTERVFVSGSETAPGGIGTIAVQNGGRLDVGQQLHVWSSGTVSVDSSSFAVIGDASDIAGAVHVGVGGTLSGDGTILADVINSGGTVSPGASPGLFTIDGDFEQLLDGELLIELGGLIPGEEFDVLNILGSATLGGDLRVTALDRFTPTPGDMFEFLLASGFSGDFDSFIDETGFGLQLDFNGGVGTLTATVPEPATAALLLLAVPLVRRRR